MKDDTISRAEALTALNGCTEIFLNNLPPTIDRADAVDAIKALPPAQPVEDIQREKEQAYYCGYEDGAKAARSAQPGWIPCSESPMKNNSYLVWMPFAPEGHHITVAEWCGSYWNIKTPITAWMPLPAPYIPEGDDKHEG